MYQKILIALDNSPPEQALLDHVARLAVRLQSRLLLLHVADGWVARNYDALQLAESEEMKEDMRYLDETAARLRAETGLTVSVRLSLGSPPDQILKTAGTEQCDLIALASHGHRLIGDILHGSTIEAVRHHARVPILAFPPKK